MSENIFKRLNLFFRERYPLFTGILSSIVGTMSMYLVWAAIHDGAMVILDRYVFVSILSMFLVTLILRLSDEIKDKEVDRVIFPERCLPSGKVKYSDIYVALIFFSILFFILNLFFGGNKFLFYGLCIYLFLFYKYFFFPKQISNNLMMALVTHNPLLVVMSLYLISIFSAQQDLDIFNLKNILLAVAFWMPSLTWETARKIRAPHRETDYTTYSKAIGPRISCLLPLGAMLVQYLCISYLVKDLAQGYLIIIGSGIIYCLFLFHFSLFLVSLKSRYARYFQLLTEGQILANSFLIVVVSFMEIR
jgi:4-hydroxybenzoate polyprenyltransferase